MIVKNKKEVSYIVKNIKKGVKIMRYTEKDVKAVGKILGETEIPEIRKVLKVQEPIKSPRHYEKIFKQWKNQIRKSNSVGEICSIYEKAQDKNLRLIALNKSLRVSKNFRDFLDFYEKIYEKKSNEKKPDSPDKCTELELEAYHKFDQFMMKKIKKAKTFQDFRDIYKKSILGTDVMSEALNKIKEFLIEMFNKAKTFQDFLNIYKKSPRGIDIELKSIQKLMTLAKTTEEFMTIYSFSSENEIGSKALEMALSSTKSFDECWFKIYNLIRHCQYNDEVKLKVLKKLIILASKKQEFAKVFREKKSDSLKAKCNKEIVKIIKTEKNK